MYSSSHVSYPHWYQYKVPNFLSMGSLSLGLTNICLMVPFPFKWVWILHLLQVFLMYSPLSLFVRNNYVTFTVFVLVGVPPCGVTTGVAGVSSGDSLWVLLSSQLLKIFLSTISKAHLGYLLLVRALLKCCNFLVRNSGPVQITFALWEIVLTTLYLAARIWWLPHCKYW